MTPEKDCSEDGYACCEQQGCAIALGNMNGIPRPYWNRCCRNEKKEANGCKANRHTLWYLRLVKKRELVVPFEVCAEAADELKRLEKAVLHQQILHGLF